MARSPSPRDARLRTETEPGRESLVATARRVYGLAPWLTWCMLIFPVVAALAEGVMLTLPAARPFAQDLVAEDHLVENVEFVSYLVAAVLAVRWARARASRGARAPAVWWAVLLAGLCFGLGGEEVSWGQRWFHIPTPAWLKHANAQGEVTIHNLDLLQQWVFWYPLIPPVLALWSILRTARPRRDAQGVPSVLLPACVVAILLAGYDNLTDNFPINLKFDTLIGELGEIVELLVALGFMFGIGLVARRESRASASGAGGPKPGLGAVALVLLALGAAVPAGGAGVIAARDAPGVVVFEGAALDFRADSSARPSGAGVDVEDRGRVVARSLELPAADGRTRIVADLTLRPVAKSEREVFDRWDRAGNVRLVVPGKPDVEIVRFITSYGGRTDHEVDVSALAPLLHGPCRMRAFVDTWTSPGWELDCRLRYVPDTLWDAPTWAAPVYYTDDFNRQAMPQGVEVTVDVPKGLSRVVLRYLSTGHCTDGTDADEFVSKANVISVDGVVVARVHPWRDDCRRFRDRNPYCARLSDGTWSSDYSRSGWCPGDIVAPSEFDLTDHLEPGRHRLRFRIEDMRPKDARGNYGYWRVSACLVGWARPPQLWKG